MGQGCSSNQPNEVNVERSLPDMESPLFVGMQLQRSQTGLGGAPQYCPKPTELPVPCGKETRKCAPKCEAQRLPDRAETVTCNVTEWKLSCQWTPVTVQKRCQVMVPQYRAVCSNQPEVRVRRYEDFIVNPAADINGDNIISPNELLMAQERGLARPVNMPSLHPMYPMDGYGYRR